MDRNITIDKRKRRTTEASENRPRSKPRVHHPSLGQSLSSPISDYEAYTPSETLTQNQTGDFNTQFGSDQVVQVSSEWCPPYLGFPESCQPITPYSSHHSPNSQDDMYVDPATHGQDQGQASHTIPDRATLDIMITGFGQQLQQHPAQSYDRESAGGGFMYVTPHDVISWDLLGAGDLFPQPTAPAQTSYLQESQMGLPNFHDSPNNIHVERSVLHGTAHSKESTRGASAQARTRQQNVKGGRSSNPPTYRNLAPNPRSYRAGTTEQEGSSPRGSKPRQTRQTIDPPKTAILRRIRCCIPCRNRRVACDVTSVYDICQRCHNGGLKDMCIRLRPSNLTGYRKTNSRPWETQHPMTGKGYGDFDKPMSWTGDVKTIWVTHFGGRPIGFEMRQFDCNGSDFSIDLSNPLHRVYRIPFAMPCPNRASKALDDYIKDPSITWDRIHMFFGMDGSPNDQNYGRRERLYRLCFQQAWRWAFGKKEKSTLVQKALHIWMASRFLDGGMAVYGDETLGFQNPREGLPPSLCYQILALLMNDIIPALLWEFIDDLKKRLLETPKMRKCMWLEVLLATFVILTSLEVNLEKDERHARRMKYETRFVDSKTIEKFLADADNLLAHFHFYWQSMPSIGDIKEQGVAVLRGIVELDSRIDDEGFIEALVQEIGAIGRPLETASQGNDYARRYYFVGQLFVENWKRSQVPFENPRVHPTGPYPVAPAYVSAWA